MRIEETTIQGFQELVGRADNATLRSLRWRCNALFHKYFWANPTPCIKIVHTDSSEATLDRADLLAKYRLVRKALAERGLRISTLPIDLALMKQGMLGIDARGLTELVIVENYISIGGSYIKGPHSAADVDVVIREKDQNRDEGLELKLGRQIKRFTPKPAHFVYSERGPHSTYIPLYDLVLRPRETTERVEVKEDKTEKGDGLTIEPADKAAITPGRSFTPLKTRGGYGKLEFADKAALWTTWAQGYIPEPGVAVETKYDGFRIQIHVKDGVRILSEDAKRDLAPCVKALAEELKSFPGPAVLDAELLLYDEGKKVARQDMPSYLAESYEGAFKATAEVFDILWHDGQALNEKTWEERQEALTGLFGKVDEKDVHRVKPTVAKTKDAFMSAIDKHSKEAHSEGAMLKVINSIYPLQGQTAEWAKFKNFKSLTVKVTDREQKEGGGWIYTCELADGVPIGRTYATKLEAKTGSILEVAAAEVKYEYDDAKDQATFTWDNPIVRETKAPGTALTTGAQAKALAELGRTRKDKRESNVTFAEETTGTGIAQVHVMGIPEDKVQEIKDAGKRLVMARGDLGKLASALKGILGERGAHIDMRFRPGKENFWEGNEVFVGNLSGLPKLGKLKEPNEKLRAEWKVPHADEPEGSIRGPLGWMEAGTRAPEIFSPGEPGATANTYGMMLRIDTFAWRLYSSAEHAKKFRIEGGRYFDGNFLFAFVPVEGGRIWMISRLPEDDHEKVEKKLTAAERADCDAETERIRENRKTATYPHKFKAAKWTHPNGHPRCLICGQEEDTRGACRRPTGRILKDFDPLDQTWKMKETAWFKFIKTDKKRHLVGGVVYEPDSEDTQGDWTDAGEIEKALERFMLRYSDDPKRIRVNHKGQIFTFPIIECFQPEEPTRKGKEIIPAGAWWLMIKVTDKNIWSRIEKGELQGFSMGGTARGQGRR